ncbi:MAG: helix-turn-helix domain-containing protein [Firmicutes bacterium]|nr:helix-turn-helix domain-containing protein [Bacillota bacterium]
MGYKADENLFPERLKALRIKRGLNRSELAQALGMAKSSNNIQRWEEDKQSPDINYLILICQYFRVSADYLVGLADE